MIPHVIEASFDRSRPAVNDPWHFLSQADGEEIFRQLSTHAEGGGLTAVAIYSAWTGNVRWGANRITTAGETVNHGISVVRTVRGATNLSSVGVNDESLPMLVAAVRRAERLTLSQQESAMVEAVINQPLEGVESPNLFSQATVGLDADERARAAQALMRTAADTGMRSAGYIEVSGKSMAVLDTTGRRRYQQWTEAQYSTTVRNPRGDGSGWAGTTSHDWAKIDGLRLSQIALDKCLRSQSPVRVEPGRYTTVLEPQAVSDLMAWFGINEIRDRPQVGQKIMDERLTIQSDPLDPVAGFPAWSNYYGGYVRGMTVDLFAGYQAAHARTWVRDGVLVSIPYGREDALETIGRDRGNPYPGAISMTGGTTTLDEMIASTQRGLYVTRFSGIEDIAGGARLLRGYTRDGLWLIENGKISKPAKNLIFTQLLSGMLNNVEQLGVPQRTFRPAQWGMSHPLPAVVPPMKIRDFSFTALIDAV